LTLKFKPFFDKGYNVEKKYDNLFSDFDHHSVNCSLHLCFLGMAGARTRTGTADPLQPQCAQRRQTDTMPVLPPLRRLLKFPGHSPGGKVSALPQLHNQRTPADPKGAQVFQHTNLDAMGKSKLRAGTRSVQPPASYQQRSRLPGMPRIGRKPSTAAFQGLADGNVYGMPQKEECQCGLLVGLSQLAEEVIRYMLFVKKDQIAVLLINNNH